MEGFASSFKGKRVFVTGHTGFKGSWLCEWLLLLGAEVWGYSLPPPTEPALFDQLGLAQRMKHQIGDIRDAEAVRRAVVASQPEFVFHLAAQSLVRLSFEQPVETFATNVMGTAHLLDALRDLQTPCAAVIITSDKCYENREDGSEYHEADALGGRDPYSASKAAAELTVAAWRKSFFSPDKILRGEAAPVGLASARAGNVMGGGDWARDRLMPDCLRALGHLETIVVRNPASVRPWQHVLEPLAGYLELAARLRTAVLARSADLPELCSAFNFGPISSDHCTVEQVVAEVLKVWPGRWVHDSQVDAVPEARRLHLSTDKARRVLGWQPRWRVRTAVAKTIAWQQSEGPYPERIRNQIAEYSTAR